MRYIVFSDGKEINTIEATEDFAAEYAAQTGFTLEPAPLPVVPVVPPEPTVEERLAAAEEALLALMGVTADV